ncbi:hypothetical protein HGI30_02855 [Paenibacillus albicereus]|uniref:ABM domain-containing protein n=1 Tax=Paenibacillus albicereus TaxID=2726185 RepID=A0A6H2GTE2_9BACL|nr:antibiotic biosynthesis monooxygenase [Paenibacillus albicereus]QJC50629.1 hypothetical protein HGI30_02855 [Paenibacillus albicereus]
MIVVTNTIQIKSGYGEQVSERFKQARGVQSMPGFIGMELLLARAEEADELKVVTHWQDKESFDGWVASDSFKQAHARRAPEPAAARAEGEAPADPAQPMGGTAMDGNPVGAETAADAAEGSGGSVGDGGHPASGGSEAAGAGRHGSEAAGPDPRSLMLGAKLSVHEVLFALKPDSL